MNHTKNRHIYISTGQWYVNRQVQSDIRYTSTHSTTHFNTQNDYMDMININTVLGLLNTDSY